MINGKSILQGSRRLLPFIKMLCFAVCLLLAAHQAVGQAAPAGTWPTGDTNPADQPLPGQQLGTDLTLNQGVNAISAENESFDRFGFGIEASGGAETNFLGTRTNQVTAAYAQFSGEVGLRLRNNRTSYFALYQPQYTVYPQYSQVNNYAQQFYQTLAHSLTERAGITWDVTAARFLSLNQFLPQTLGIGGIGIVVPTVGTQLQENSFEATNAATSLKFRYLMSTRMTFTGTLATSYFLLVPSSVSGPNGSYAERFVTSGADFRLDYQLTPRNTVGGAITPVYIYGISPSGHELAETIQATYQRQLTATLNASVGAGPLFIQASSPLYGSIQDTSYAINAGLSRQIRQSQFQLTYSRAFVVDLLSPPIVSNSFGFNTYFPMKKQWILVGAATYTRQAGTRQYGTESIYGGSAQLAYRVGSRMQLFSQYSFISENLNQELSVQPYGFTRNQFGGGIRFNLGNSITRGGVQ